MKRLACIVALCLGAIGSSAAQTAVPPLVNYQGTLTDEVGVPIPDDMKKLEFRLYDAALGGTVVWGPQVFDTVPVVNGRFNVILGTTDSVGRSIAGAFGSDQRFLGFKVGDVGQALDAVTEISPRQQILSTPFALVAGTVHGPVLNVSSQIEVGAEVPGSAEGGHITLKDGNNAPAFAMDVFGDAFRVIGAAGGGPIVNLSQGGSLAVTGNISGAGGRADCGPPVMDLGTCRDGYLLPPVSACAWRLCNACGCSDWNPGGRLILTHVPGF